MSQFLRFKQLKNLIPAFSIVFTLLLPSLVFATTLYLEHAEGEYHQGDIFIIEVRLNTEGEYINTGEVNLTFSPDTLEMKDFSKGNSIFTLWVADPSFSNQTGTVSFAGGIPGGYQGKDGLLGKLIFQAKKQNVGEVQFRETSQILLNDGLGTKAELKIKGASFHILAENVEGPQNEWLKELTKDTIPPETFPIEIHQTPAIFDGKYFITFSTTDKQTGVDHYEVKEGKKDWKIVQSPYILANQRLTDETQVKAVDKAGNERIMTAAIGKSFFLGRGNYLLLLFLLGGAIGIYVIGRILWRVFFIKK